MAAYTGLKIPNRLIAGLRQPLLSPQALLGSVASRTAGRQLQARRRLPAAGRRGAMMTSAVSAPARPAQRSSASDETNLWDVTFRVHNAIKNAPLVIQLKDEDTGALSEAIDVASFETKPWDRSATGDGDGTYLIGKLPLGDVKNPGAALISYVGPQAKKAEEKAKQLSRIYVTDLTLKAGDKEVVISAHSWCNAVHTEIYGPRIFFKAGALLPHQTPKALVADRQLDLAIIQGVDEAGQKIRNNPRQPADRIEDYATYNDLGDYKKTSTARPVLGDPSIDGYAYPRRVATNRGLNPDGKTEIPPKGDRWVPADDDFDETKVGSFNSSLKLAALPLVVEQLTTAARRLGGVGAVAGWWGAIVAAVLAIFTFGRNLTKGAASGVIGGFWDSFAQLTAIYDNREDTAINQGARIGRTDEAGNYATLSEEEKNKETFDAVNELPTEERNLVLRRAGIDVKDFEAPDQRVSPEKYKVLRHSVNDKLDWPEPLVIAGHHTPKTASDLDADHRHDAWRTDEEFGRQFVAGPNPLVLAAARELPANSAFKDNIPLIDGFLEGHSLEKLMAAAAAGDEPRAFIVDYDPYMSNFAPIVNGQKQDRCLYAGRALFYKRNDTKLVPVALELHAPGTAAAARTVYTPRDPPQVWMLAKAAFGSIDSGVHQLVSHWLRTHACVEPYIIATDRNLSQLHPVYKLLQPHLQYTYRINADARSVLIAADKIVELVFTPGSQAMQLSAAVYADWQFKDQAFPVDTVNRGLAKQKSDGSVEIIAGDHPWAEDGLLVWNALHTYVLDYLRVYYKSDKDVTSDPELNAWWDEIKNKGHPDAKPEGWPELKTVDDLAFILATITWTTSAHHAAVNFGQADYSSMPLNRSSLLRKPIPAPGTTAYEKLTDLKQFEKEFLRYLANQLPASIVIAVMEILSTHAENEHYLTDEHQNYIADEEALAVHARLKAALAEAEETILRRNSSGNSAARSPSQGGLPYQLLIPSGVDSKGNTLPASAKAGQRVANRPGRGIPFSISI